MHLLLIRFSAIGDVALTVPVILGFKKHYPEIKISVLSRPLFRSLFEPLEVDFIPADLKGEHEGITGLRRLYKEIIAHDPPDIVLDLHSVLRTHALSSFFQLSGIPVYRIDKGRGEKRLLTRRYNKVRKDLIHTTERYAQVFEKAGFNFAFQPEAPLLPHYQAAGAQELWQDLKITKPAVGLAPLAGFPGKTWPLTKVARLIEELTSTGFFVFLFGGPEDRERLGHLAGEDIHNLSGELNFAEEVSLMCHLKLMISMDSSNMHLAALAGIPVVSIWGSTHHYGGFGPLGDNNAFIAEVPVEQLQCRPCSVFGKRPCFRKDYACQHWLKEEDVLAKVQLALKKSEGL